MERRYEAVFSALEHATTRGVELRDYDRMFDLALKLYGHERAYPWLVKAHREQRGWNRYFTSEEKAHRRWEYIKRLYPQRWFDFVKQTLQQDNGGAPWQNLYLDSDRTARIVDYCLRLNEIEVAKDVTKRLVESSLRLVEELPLSKPSWTNEE